MRGMATLESGHMRIAADAMVAATLLYVVQPSHVLDAFVYPPHANMLLLPFGAMPSGAALAIWTALNLFCLLRARELLGSPPDLILIAAVSPLTVIMVATGYPVGFLALMMTIVLAQGHERPGPAGLCLALMTVHPQLAFGFALLLLPGLAWT